MAIEAPAIGPGGPGEGEMIGLYETPTSWIAGGGLLLIGLGAAVRGVRLMARGLRLARGLDLVRGIRVVIVGFVCGMSALGVLAAEPGFIVVAAIILAEELYETATLAALLRAGGR